jgi:hypothetical protein
VIERAVVIDIELVEQGACGGLRLIEIDGPIVVGVEDGERRGRGSGQRGRRAQNEHPPGRETASKEASVRVFKFANFINVLLESSWRTVTAEHPPHFAPKLASNRRERLGRFLFVRDAIHFRSRGGLVQTAPATKREGVLGSYGAQ